MAQLEPGPIPVINSDWLDASVSANGLAAYVSDQLSELDQVEGDMDTWLDPAAAIADALPDDGLSAPLDAIDGSLEDISLTVDAWQPDVIQQAYDDMGARLVNIFSIVPAEAWQDVPPEQQFGDAAAVTDIPNPFTAALTTVDQVPLTDVAAGQTVLFSLHIGPREGGGGQIAGVPVREYGWKEGAVQFSHDVGATSQFGFLSFTQIFGPDDVGAWQIEFFGVQPDGSLTSGPLLSFNVTPSAIPLQPMPPPTPLPVPQPAPQPTPGPVQVDVGLVNGSGVRAFPDFVVGDTWTLTVVGPPDSPVVIGGFQNNQALAQAQLGVTGHDGRFVLTGVMDAEHVGLWQETYSVGGVDWQGALLFSVNPAPGA